jgi:flagellin-specific chaperone FliS
MQMLARNPAATYRRIELDARIEASGRADLTRICLEEAVAALGQALIALDRSQVAPREPLARAQSIMVWLTQSVAPDHPLAGSLRQFYGGLANQIGANILQPEPAAIGRVANDIRELLDAAG